MIYFANGTKKGIHMQTHTDTSRNIIASSSPSNVNDVCLILTSLHIQYLRAQSLLCHQAKRMTEESLGTETQFSWFFTSQTFLQVLQAATEHTAVDSPVTSNQPTSWLTANSCHLPGSSRSTVES